jgi:hypothetical protein
MSITAELHGKTPFTYFEDLLTSDVFTVFRYLPADKGIIGFLRTVRGMDAVIEAPDPDSTCKLHFWPRGRYREPDLLLELSIRGRLYHVVIEAKYLSGPSDSEDSEATEAGETVRVIGNQLAGEFEELQHGHYRVRAGGWRWLPLELRSASEDRALVYLTAHDLPPEEVLCQFRRYHPESVDKLFWASWYQIYEYLAADTESWRLPPYREIIGDLLALLRQKGFSSFRGIPRAPELQQGSLPRHHWLG